MLVSESVESDKCQLSFQMSLSEPCLHTKAGTDSADGIVYDAIYSD